MVDRRGLSSNSGYNPQVVKLLEALRTGVLLGDGANGTLLSESGYSGYPYDLANLEAPDLVRAAHRAYFEAGADFVETNTFQGNRIRLGSRVNIRDLNVAGAALAREVAGSERLVLGAIGPAGRALSPIGPIQPKEWAEAVQEQALALEEGGCDGFLLETFIDMEELRIAVESIRAVSQVPILVSKAYIEDGEMLSRGLPIDCTQDMLELGVFAVGANCIVGPQRMLDLVRMISETTELPILAMPTPGLPQLVKGKVVYDTSAEYFAKATARLIDEGATLIGGCCGTTPEHIRALRAEIGTGHGPSRKSLRSRQQARVKEELEPSESSELSQKLGTKFVVAVEMDVPRGLKLDGLLASARALKIAGADVINISDGARARLRVNPMAVSDLIQSKVGIEVTMHFSCRDRNLLAVQADLLGCHSLGIRNILAVTGDPATIGDYPSATSVFDIDAVGLVRILDRFNHGLDLAGYGLGQRCAFTICCAYNPIAVDPETELERLKAKVDAGAKVVYTQPLFDEKHVHETAELCQSLGVHVLMGILPIRSLRHSEFMHNEVPGIEIPEWFRNKVAEAGSDDEVRKIGVEESIRLSQVIRHTAQGVYLMPPAGNHEVARQIITSLG